MPVVKPEAVVKPETGLRKALVAASLELVRRGLNEGTAGNISARLDEGLLITPSGIPPEMTTPRMIAAMPLNGDGAARGPRKPSSEWRLHRDILAHRPDVGAVVHTHSTYCTVLACQHRAIPALHYMIAAFGVAEIACTPYVPFGTQALSDLIIEHLGGGHGVLLGNHGMVATGTDLAQAMWRAVELEALARMYYLATAGGGAPALLSADEIARTIERFAGYGMTAVDRRQKPKPQAYSGHVELEEGAAAEDARPVRHVSGGTPPLQETKPTSRIRADSPARSRGRRSP